MLLTKFLIYIVLVWAPPWQNKRPSYCEQTCSIVDTDILHLPANRCIAGGYLDCVAECELRMPRGNWCPPP